MCFWFNALFFTVLGLQPIIAQTVMRGRVLSQEDQQVVPYTLITDPQHRFGMYADADGRFVTQIPMGVDTLLITCIGFHEQRISIKELPDYLVIKLLPKQTVLSEVVVRSRRPRTIVIGAIRKRAPILWGNCSGRNIEFALYIRNTKGIVGYLQKVAYLIARGGRPTAPFRVRIYEYVDGTPGSDLLPSSVIAMGQRGNSWCEVDLSRYQIPFPKEGLFVAMEWLPTNEPRYQFSSSFRTPNGQQHSLDCFGQYLAFSKELRSASYWERINGGHWRQHSTFSRTGAGEHPVIQAKISLMRQH